MLEGQQCRSRQAGEKKTISEVLKAMNEISQGDVLQTPGDGAETRAKSKLLAQRGSISGLERRPPHG